MEHIWGNIKSKHVTLVALFIWFLLLGSSFYVSWQQELNAAEKMAVIEARSSYNKDLVYRRWSSLHGGVYVSPTESTPPNPHLAHIPKRDVVTQDGQQLTLINPAYMTRQVHELGQEQYGDRGHITSLNPLRKENEPDPWEKSALLSFQEEGTTVITSLEMMDGQPYMRFMKSMIAEEGCLKCHGQQGYKLGDIRGGISVSVPFAPYLTAANKHNVTIFSAHVLIAAIGCLGIWFAGRTIADSQQALSASEKRHRLALDAANDGVWEWDIKTNEEYFSPRWCEIIGYSYDDPQLPHTYDSWAKRIHPDDHDRVMKLLSDHLEQGDKYEVEYRHLHKSGEYRWQKSVGETERGHSGEPVKMYGYISDIHQRKTIEEQLRKSEARLKEAQKLAHIGNWELNLVTGDLVWSDEVYRIFEIESGLEPLSYESFLEFVHPEDRDFVDSEYQRSLKGKSDYDIVHRILLPGGTTKHVHERCQTLFNEEGAVRSLGTVQDITDQIDAENKRSELEKQLHQKHKMEAIGVMAGGMAHNFNNNLAVILGNLELAQLKSSQSEEVRTLLTNAKKALMQSRDLIKKIMVYSRNEEMDKRLVGAKDVFEQAIFLLRPTIPSTVELNLELSSLPDEACIYADQSSVQEIVLNLSNNAIQAMNEKGRLGFFLDFEELSTTDLPVESNGLPRSYAKFSVADTGCGISEDKLGKIFDPFFTTKDVGKGTGMGLATVQGIVESLNGFIKVCSAEGEGTVFELYFPLVNGASQGTEEAHSDIPKGTEKILFLDDEADIVALGKAMLEELGYKVTGMTDASQALAEIENNIQYYDLVITDQTMPKLTGEDLAIRIKQIRPDLPIILCTGYSSQISSSKAKKIGIEAFCYKPLDLAMLSQQLREILDA